MYVITSAQGVSHLGIKPLNVLTTRSVLKYDAAYPYIGHTKSMNEHHHGVNLQEESP